MPELRSQEILRILQAHRIYHPEGALCFCGWDLENSVRDSITTRTMEDKHLEHVADKLADEIALRIW